MGKEQGFFDVRTILALILWGQYNGPSSYTYIAEDGLKSVHELLCHMMGIDNLSWLSQERVAFFEKDCIDELARQFPDVVDFADKISIHLALFRGQSVSPQDYRETAWNLPCLKALVEEHKGGIFVKPLFLPSV